MSVDDDLGPVNTLLVDAIVAEQVVEQLADRTLFRTYRDLAPFPIPQCVEKSVTGVLLATIKSLIVVFTLAGLGIAAQKHSNEPNTFAPSQ